VINEVILEGIVVREPWRFMDDLPFRIGVYRDSDQPAEAMDNERDAPDNINIRVDGGVKSRAGKKKITSCSTLSTIIWFSPPLV